MKRKAESKSLAARAEDVRMCDLCGEMILGEYDCVRTRRKTNLYFCKNMNCRKGKIRSENY